MGFLAGLFLAFLVASFAWDGDLSTFGVEGLLFFAFALAVGFVLPRSTGIAMTGLSAGSVIALIISIFKGDMSGVWISIVILGGSILVQNLIVILRPGASASVGAYVSTDIWRRFRS